MAHGDLPGERPTLLGCNALQRFGELWVGACTGLHARATEQLTLVGLKSGWWFKWQRRSKMNLPVERQGRMQCNHFLYECLLNGVWLLGIVLPDGGEGPEASCHLDPTACSPPCSSLHPLFSKNAMRSSKGTRTPATAAARPTLAAAKSVSRGTSRSHTAMCTFRVRTPRSSTTIAAIRMGRTPSGATPPIRMSDGITAIPYSKVLFVLLFDLLFCLPSSQPPAPNRLLQTNASPIRVKTVALASTPRSRSHINASAHLRTRDPIAKWQVRRCCCIAGVEDGHATRRARGVEPTRNLPEEVLLNPKPRLELQTKLCAFLFPIRILGWGLGLRGCGVALRKGLRTCVRCSIPLFTECPKATASTMSLCPMPAPGRCTVC